MIGWEPPTIFRKFRADDVMNDKIISFKVIEKVRNVVAVLEENEHNGFPIIDKRGRFVGIILRDQIITLIKSRAFQKDQFVGTSFYPAASLEKFIEDYPR